ncbi:MAG TPA: hypothetical protein VHE08_06855 [Solirubrobacterales bacterium]|nr:hypothetical protein [Solirubrobacterales bacterium]
MGGWRWGTARGAAIAVVAVALLAAGAPASSAAKKKSKKAAPPAPFCTNPADNYMAPLERLRPIPAPPEDGALPFATGARAGMTIGTVGPQGVLVGASNVGFRLSNTAPAGGVVPKLNWTVLERLTRLSHEGHRLHPAGLKRIDLRRLPPGKHRGLTFPILDEPAIYSLEVTIQNHRGRLLGRYGEYIRVVSRVLNAGLTLASYDKIAPGSYVESCFENHGSASVTPTGTSLERLDGGNWRPVVVGPQYSPAQTPIQRTLGPGESEKIGTLVPPDALPGLYKLNATGTVLDSGEAVAVTAEFGVL